MNCPSCGIEMERDDYGDVRMRGLTKIIYDPPEALYHCEDCGCEVKWQKGYPLKVIFDPRTGKYGEAEIDGDQGS